MLFVCLSAISSVWHASVGGSLYVDSIDAVRDSSRDVAVACF